MYVDMSFYLLLYSWCWGPGFLLEIGLSGSVRLCKNWAVGSCMLTLKFFNEVGQTNIFINRVRFGFLSFQFYYYYD